MSNTLPYYDDAYLSLHEAAQGYYDLEDELEEARYNAAEDAGVYGSPSPSDKERIERMETALENLRSGWGDRL